jgi:dihydrodipicolinate synthase/N-acetylneuraminate lyase
LYKQGQKEEAKALFYQPVPYLSFAMQHLEVAVHIEKRVLVRRGILPNARMRQPTMTLDATYQQQMDDLVTMVVALCNECREKSASTV